MQYLLTIYHDEKSQEKLTPEQWEEVMVRFRKYAQSVRDAGIYLGANPLRPTSTATSVRVRDGKQLVTDGPFAETMEQLAGYFLIDVPNLDVALEWAAKIPAAEWGTIEVRPVAVDKQRETL